MKNIVVIIFYQALLGRCLDDAGHWDYDDQQSWCDISNLCCGKHQSPIRLWDRDRKTPMTPFKFTNYSQLPTTATLTNDGKSTTLRFTGVKPEISGGGLQHTYVLNAVHFHWGVNNHLGSEHILNGRQAPMEIHLVHYNSKFSNLSEAIASGECDATAVLGVLYWLSNRLSNPALGKIASGLRRVIYNGQSTNVEPFSFHELLPVSTKYFYRYLGSFTSPTCNEVVVWTVFRDLGTITATQMKAFRKTCSSSIHEVTTKTMANNYREVQRLNRRTVYQGVEARNKWDHCVGEGHHRCIFENFYKCDKPM